MNNSFGDELVKTYRRMQNRGAWLIIAGLGLAFAITALWRPSPPPNYNKLGIHLLLDDGDAHWPESVWSQHLDYAARLVGSGGYVVQLIRADDMDVSRWQKFMDACAARNLRPIIRLATTYDRAKAQWRAPTPDADGGYRTIGRAYALFISQLIWPTDEHLVILLNEPNRGDEWGGTARPKRLCPLRNGFIRSLAR